MKHVMIVLGLLMALFVTVSCSDKKQTQDRATKLQIEKTVQIVNNPEFNNVADFVNYVIDQKEHQRFRAVISRLTLSEINEMSKVIVNRDSKINWKTFLREYDNNYQTVYRYLEEPQVDTQPYKKETDTVSSVGNKNNNLNIVKDGTTNVSSSIQR